MHHQFECNGISDSQSFRSTQQSRLKIVTIIIALCQTGVQSQKLGVQLSPLLQHRTTTAPNGWEARFVIPEYFF